jgi:hypothetical protein
MLHCVVRQLSFNLSRTARTVTARYERGTVDITRSVVDVERCRFPSGPLRFVMFSRDSSSTFWLFRVNGTIILQDGEK